MVVCINTTLFICLFTTYSPRVCYIHPVRCHNRCLVFADLWHLRRLTHFLCIPVFSLRIIIIVLSGNLMLFGNVALFREILLFEDILLYVCIDAWEGKKGKLDKTEIRKWEKCRLIVFHENRLLYCDARFPYKPLSHKLTAVSLPLIGFAVGYDATKLSYYTTQHLCVFSLISVHL